MLYYALEKGREEVVGDWAWFIDEPKAGRGLPLVGFHSLAHLEIGKNEKSPEGRGFSLSFDRFRSRFHRIMKKYQCFHTFPKDIHT